MSNAIVNSAKSTHYAVSTVAAIVYGLVWLLSNRAHAEMEAAMPEVLVTAQREAVQTEMPEVIVWGTRADMPEILVTAKRDGDRRFASNDSLGGVHTRVGWLAKARMWVRTALVK